MNILCRLYITLLAVGIATIPASAAQRASGFCEVGGTTVTLSGLPGYQSTPKVQGSFPGCTVTVYQSGTTTLAAIYGDNNGTTKSNPFTADSTTGYWFFYTSHGRYDIKYSGGGLASAFTNGDQTILDYTGPSSVKDFGAKGDGSTDDTAAINTALANANSVYFPDGTYLIACDSTTDSRFTAGGIAPQSNSVLTFGGNAVLKCKPNASGYYAAIRLYGVSNVWIYGGQLDGQKSLSTASSSTQSGMGVVVRGASNVWIYSTVAHDFWGDGFYIDRISDNVGALITNSKNINFTHVLSQNNRRQGMSIQMADGVKIVGSVFTGTCCNTGPGDGIDIEPNFNLNSVNDVQIIGSTFSNNIDAPNGNGSGIALTCPAGLGTITNVKIIGGKSTGNGAYGVRVQGNQCSGVLVDGMNIENNVNPGILANSVADGALTITNNYLAGNSNNAAQGGSQNSNVLITSSTGVRFISNTVRAGTNTTKPTYGINMQGNTSTYVVNNDFAGAASSTTTEWTANDAPYYCGNRLSSGMQGCTDNAGLNVIAYGAKGDGTTDDTVAINAALAASHTVFFPSGNYLINCDSSTDGQWTFGGIGPQNNSVLNFGGNATLTCKPNTSGFYAAIRLYGTAGVTINGGTLDGQRSLDTGPTGTQSGMGVACTGCSGLIINGTVAKNFWGDGFFFTRNASVNVHANNIVVSGITADNNRRNGLSLESAQNFKAVNSTFKGSNGTAPQFGVDIEPGGPTTLVNNAEFLNCTYSGNTWEGIGIESFDGSNVSGVKIRGGIVQGNTDNLQGGIYVYNTQNPVEISGVLVTGNTGNGIYIANTTDVILADNVLVGNNTSNSVGNQSGIYIQNSIRPHVTGNVFRQGSGHQIYAVYLPGDTNLFMTQNDFTGSGSSADYREVSPTGSLITANKLTTGAYLTGALGPPAYSPATPALSPANVAQTVGRTYPIELGPQTTDGSYSLGTGDWNTDAVLEVRGGQYSANNNVGLSNLSGIRFMRGTSATAFETLLTLNNSAIFAKPVSAPSYTANGVAGVSVSGTSCTVKAVVGGIVTSATCP